MSSAPPPPCSSIRPERSFGKASLCAALSDMALHAERTRLASPPLLRPQTTPPSLPSRLSSKEVLARAALKGGRPSLGDAPLLLCDSTDSDKPTDILWRCEILGPWNCSGESVAPSLWQ